MLRGVAVNARGEREGSMGVSAGDFDHDGDADLFVTHMVTETNMLNAEIIALPELPPLEAGV